MPHLPTTEPRSSSSSIATPSVSARVARFFARGPWRDALGVATILIIVVIAYSEVVFEGKTLMMNDRVQGIYGQGCFDNPEKGNLAPLGFPKCLTAEESRNDPRPDPGAGAWALTPWARTVHREIAGGDAPIWNPYEGIGAPLAANMQSAAFDPLLLPYHLDPRSGVRDLSMLLGLMLTGAATYLFARVIGLSYLPSTLTATVYVLSGWFFGYSNNDWFRTYLYLPVILACVEWCLRSRLLSSLAALGVAIAGMIAIGMPEPAFIALSASSLYALVRLLVGPRCFSRSISTLRLAAGAATGLLLAAPLLLLFAEYIPRSFNSHEHLGSATPITDRPETLLNWLVPTISPTSEGPYTGTRNWIGAGVCALVVVALASPRPMKKHLGWVIAAVGTAVAFKIYGGDLVEWTRHVPLAKLALWPFFGTAVIALALAVLAGIGVQAVKDGQATRKRIWIATGVALLLFAAITTATGARLAVGIDDFELLSGWGLAALAFTAVVVVASLVPRHGAVWLVCGVVLSELLLLTPRGIYADRFDPYPQTEWATFLQEKTAEDQTRVFSQEGLLFPNAASAYGLRDPRALDALYIDRYWSYLRRFISPAIVDRYTADERADRDGPQSIEGNRMFDLLGVRYLLARPGSVVAPQFRRVHESQGVQVYENEDAIPRAFVVHRVAKVQDQSAATNYLTEGERRRPDGRVVVTHKDPARQAVVETEGREIPPLPPCKDPDTSRVRFTSASATKVHLDVKTDCAGLLVFSDAYYPGWEASVNGADAEIYPTDIAFRGVFVPKGESKVEFRYAPTGFSIGLFLMAIGVVAVAAAILFDIRTMRTRRRPPSSPDDIDQPAFPLGATSRDSTSRSDEGPSSN